MRWTKKKTVISILRVMVQQEFALALADHLWCGPRSNLDGTAAAVIWTCVQLLLSLATCASSTKRNLLDCGESRMFSLSSGSSGADAHFEPPLRSRGNRGAAEGRESSAPGYCGHSHGWLRHSAALGRSLCSERFNAEDRWESIYKRYMGKVCAALTITPYVHVKHLISESFLLTGIHSSFH